MKYRILSILAMSALICTAAGCSADSSSESDSSAPQTTQTVSSETTVAPSNNENKQDSSAPKEKKLYDNGEIYSNICLLGRQLSSPLTVGDLGDDFEFSDSMCIVYYKGESVGIFTLENCEGPEDIKKSTRIKDIYIDDRNISGSEEPIISVYGITVGDTRDDVCNKIGAPSRTLETSMSLTDDYRGDYGETILSFEYDAPDFEKIKQIIVYLR